MSSLQWWKSSAAPQGQGMKFGRSQSLNVEQRALLLTDHHLKAKEASPAAGDLVG